jgi:hypothetical protein
LNNQRILVIALSLVIGASFSGFGQGCGWGALPIEQADPAAMPGDVSYADDIRPRIEYYCLGCHRPGSPLGNAGGWDLSSYLLVKGSFFSIMDSSFTKRSMPPGGARRMSAEDQAVFLAWELAGFPQ